MEKFRIARFDVAYSPDTLRKISHSFVWLQSLSRKGMLTVYSDLRPYANDDNSLRPGCNLSRYKLLSSMSSSNCSYLSVSSTYVLYVRVLQCTDIPPIKNTPMLANFIGAAKMRPQTVGHLPGDDDSQRWSCRWYRLTGLLRCDQIWQADYTDPAWRYESIQGTNVILPLC